MTTGTATLDEEITLAPDDDDDVVVSPPPPPVIVTTSSSIHSAPNTGKLSSIFISYYKLSCTDIMYMHDY